MASRLNIIASYSCKTMNLIYKVLSYSIFQPRSSLAVNSYILKPFHLTECPTHLEVTTWLYSLGLCRKIIGRLQNFWGPLNSKTQLQQKKWVKSCSSVFSTFFIQHCSFTYQKDSWKELPRNQFMCIHSQGHSKIKICLLSGVWITFGWK